MKEPASGALTRRAVLGNLLAVLCTPVSVHAQGAHLPRVGVIYASSRETSQPIASAFEQSLRENGYTPDKNVTIVSRYTPGRADQLYDFAVELVASQVDLLVAWSSAGAQAAQRAAQSTPVVFLSVTAPEKIGLVESVVRPGRNITGVAFTSTETTYSKAIELLKQAAPAVTHVAVLTGQANPETMQASQAAGRALNISVEAHAAKEPEDLPGAFMAIQKSGADGLFVPPSGLAFQHRKRIIDFAATRRLPAIYPFQESSDDGGLMSFGANLAGIARQGAIFVARILKGAKPGEIPVEQPTKYDLVINIRTAKALGLTLPPALVLRADRLVE